MTEVLRGITDLPDFFAHVEDGWELDLIETGCKLMQVPELRLLRL